MTTRRRYNCMVRERPAYTVTVCSACYRASCWQGHIPCKSAGVSTDEATRIELAILGLEPRRYWKTEIRP